MLYLVVGVAALTWLLLWSTTPPPRILGVYSRPGFWYWLKVVVFFVMVKVRRWGNKTGGSGADVGYGVKSRDRPELMECVQPLSDHPKAIDAVYFNAASENGYYLVAATARRPKGVINGLLYLRIPGVGLLQLPKMPDTMLFGNGSQFAAEGLRITPVKPMAAWRIQYEGPMKMRGSPLTKYEVELDVQWTSDQPYFDFDTDMDAMALARSIAREPWSRKYFQGLKEAHQSHYEQMGRMEGTVVVDGHPYVLRLDSMRDHSYGHKREWKLMHRYGLHMFATKDGLQGNVGIICQPATCTQLEMGYIYEKGKMLAVSSVHLPLWQHGENGYPPSDYAFSFVAGGKQYVVEVFVMESPDFYIGWEWETRVVERMATFRVNGRKGWGLAEWDYRHHGGRPRAYSVGDPAWTNDLVKDAVEDTIEVKSEDEPQCVVHYPELESNKPSHMILLSDRSYKKLIECKNVRLELGGEACHDQCETIPVPNYDPKKDGYHRPCYMKFVKIKAESRKTSIVENGTDQTQNQDANCSDQSINKHESHCDQGKTEQTNNTDQSKGEQEIHSDLPHTNNDVRPENQSTTIHKDYSGDSKSKHENFADQTVNGHGSYSNGGNNESEDQCVNNSEAHCKTVPNNYSDHVKNSEKVCSDSSNKTKRKNSLNHIKTKYKNHNSFQSK